MQEGQEAGGLGERSPAEAPPLRMGEGLSLGREERRR